MVTSFMSAISTAPIENSPPGIHTIPSGASPPAGPPEFGSVGEKSEAGGSSPLAARATRPRGKKKYIPPARMRIEMTSANADSRFLAACATFLFADTFFSFCVIARIAFSFGPGWRLLLHGYGLGELELHLSFDRK